MKVRQRPSDVPTGLPALEPFRDRFQRLQDHISKIVVTSPRNIRLALLGLFAQGHVLLEDLPGVGKTLLAKTIAASIDGRFSRIQFTSDLLPTDITGTSVFDMQKQTFEFIPGPVFANVVVADELNRAGPRTQSALLEAMAEGAVSADGTVWSLPRPFVIIATQNLIESHGTFPLPISQLDRFMVSMEMGLPTPGEEMDILEKSQHPYQQMGPVLTSADVVEMQEMVLDVEISPPVKEYIVNLASASRRRDEGAVGVSPRASVALLRASQCWAACEGRAFVTPEDVQELAAHVWSHRIMREQSAGTGAGRNTVANLLQSVPVPL